MKDVLADTAAAHQLAVEQVIQAMHMRLHEPPALETLAAIAGLSPFHFSRVFRQVTGIPPGEFLAALRLDAARRLLLTTTLDVTAICYEIGYSSPGSFTTRFTARFGLAPRTLRQLATRFVPPALEREQGGPTALLPLSPADGCLSGQISAPDPALRLIFVGLFPRPIPQQRPLACTRLAAPGPYRIAAVPDGTYHLLVAALPWSSDPQTFLLPGQDLLVGRSAGALTRQHGRWYGMTDVALRPPRLTDPPLLVFLPALLS